MADSVRIVIEADDKTAAGIASAVTNLTKLTSAAEKATGAPGSGTGGGGKGVAGLSGAFKSLNGLLGAVGLPALGFTAALGGIVAVTKNAINESAKYNEQVRDQALASKTSAVEASKYLQVLDDYQLTADDAATATKALTKQGLAPSVETVAKLSEQYLKLNDAQERNAFAQKNLGKASKEWLNLLAQGPDKIKMMGDGIGSNLILTDEQIKKYEEYRLRMDAIGDSIQGVKVQAGNFFFDQADQIGAAADKASAMKRVMKEWGMENTNLGRGSESSPFIKNLELLYAQTQITGAAFNRQTEFVDSATLSYIQMAKAAQTNSGALQQTSIDYADLLKNGVALTKQQQSYTESVNKIHESMQSKETVREMFKQDLEGLRQELAKTGDYETYYQKTAALSAALKDGSFAAQKEAEAVGKLNEQMQQSAAAFALNLMQQDEAFDSQKAYDFAAATGQITQKAAEQYKAFSRVKDELGKGTLNAQQAALAVKSVSGDVKALSGLTVSTYIDVYIRTHGSMIDFGTVGAGTEGNKRKAGGGIGFASGTTDVGRSGIFRVGELGEEGLVIRSDGSVGVIPNSVWRQMDKYGVGADGAFAAGSLGVSAAGNLRRGRTFPTPNKTPTRKKTTTTTGAGTTLSALLAPTQDTAVTQMAAATQQTSQAQMDAVTQASQQQTGVLNDILTAILDQPTKRDARNNARAANQKSI